MTRHLLKTSSMKGSNPYKPHDVNKPTVSPQVGEGEDGGKTEENYIRKKIRSADNLMNETLIIHLHKQCPYFIKGSLIPHEKLQTDG